MCSRRNGGEGLVKDKPPMGTLKIASSLEPIQALTLWDQACTKQVLLFCKKVCMEYSLALHLAFFVCFFCLQYFHSGSVLIDPDSL